MKPLRGPPNLIKLVDLVVSLLSTTALDPIVTL